MEVLESLEEVYQILHSSLWIEKNGFNSIKITIQIALSMYEVSGMIILLWAHSCLIPIRLFEL